MGHDRHDRAKRKFSGYNPDVKYIILLSLALILSCQSVPLEKILEEEDMRTIRYLALGDSYTIGESVAESERWPNQLAKLLEAEGLQTEVTIIARTSWTADELWQGMQAAQPEPPYDLVSLLIGVNNQYRGYDIQGYREQFVFLLNKSIEYAGRGPILVVVLSIPDWGVTPFASDRDCDQIAREIDQFNQVNYQESQKAGVHYVDVTALSREAVRDTELIASDGLHPSGKMCAVWAEKVLPIASSLSERNDAWGRSPI